MKSMSAWAASAVFSKTNTTPSGVALTDIAFLMNSFISDRLVARSGLGSEQTKTDSVGVNVITSDLSMRLIPRYDLKCALSQICIMER
jgi:hypothetical protein